MSQGKIEAQGNQRNAKAKTTKSRGTKQVHPARPLPGGLSGPGKTLAGTARPTPTERATLEPTAPGTIISMGPWLGKAPLWWHTDLCEDIFKTRWGLEDNDARQDPCRGKPRDPRQDPCRGRLHATARPLPGPRQGPCRGHQRGHCQARASHSFPPPFACNCQPNQLGWHLRGNMLLPGQIGKRLCGGMQIFVKTLPPRHLSCLPTWRRMHRWPGRVSKRGGAATDGTGLAPVPDKVRDT